MAESTGRPRLLVVTRNFPPLWGGMERLNRHMVEELARDYEVTVIAPKGAAAQAPPAVRVVEVPLRPLWRFLGVAQWQAWRIALASRPKVVVAGSGLTAPLAWLAARSCGARALAYVHGLDLTVPRRAYRALWLPGLRRLDGVIANSRATAALARGVGLDERRIGIVHPGVSLSRRDPAARARFRAAHGLGDAPVLLSVGRLTERKGLREFVVQVLPRVVDRFPQARLVVVGDAPSQSLFARAQTPRSIQAAADAAGVGACLHFLGTRFGDELSDAYAAADLHVFPVRHIPDDPEGFGMVAVEAAAHGLATVAYATGGVVDALRDGVSGRLVPAGDAAMFAQAVCELLAAPPPRAAVLAFAEEFSWERFGHALRQLVAVAEEQLR